jgi:tRNA-splicing ligase RtcB (3'-phosphate/5'-hydroxy nucleic acid ligase)
MLVVKNWKNRLTANPGGWFDLQTEDTGNVPVRLFFSQTLLDEVEEELYGQIVVATRFPGTKMVVITPDAHPGNVVPVGSVIMTDGTISMSPVGYDIGCGMLCARSDVPVTNVAYSKRLKFNEEVLQRVGLDTSSEGRVELGKVVQREFNEIVRGGAEYYLEKYQPDYDHSRAERRRFPVDDSWQIPLGTRGKPERGISQLGSLGSGNHFIELQRCEETGTLFVMLHTGSRGFGHGLAVHYLDLAHQINPKIPGLDSGYFTPDNPHYHDYLNAVAAGANYAIVNRLMIFEQIARAFKKVFKAELELVYEISHNLVQEEEHPDFGKVWVHRKGATRAFPAHHPALAGTVWENEGHPVLIPGSNKDYSYILRPKANAVNSGYSVNHGSGRKLSRGAAKGRFDQRVIDRIYKAAGVVVNTDGKVPLEESSACYKPSEKVIEAVVQANLAEVEYRLFPLASIKGT